MRKLFAAACVTAMVVAGAAYGAQERGNGLSIEKQADLYQIGKIEKTWHRATSKKDLDLMMSIWAPNSTMTIGGATYTGKKAIRDVFTKSGPFQPQNHWVSDTPAYKIRANVNANRATFHFECHYIDVDTGKLALAAGTDLDLRRIGGSWMVTNFTASSATLSP
jgi:SnoaL-like domain